MSNLGEVWRQRDVAHQGRAPREGEVGRECELAQGGAPGEGVNFDICEVGRQRDLAQGRAPVEGGVSKLGDVRRQCDVNQGRAGTKSCPPNRDQVARQRDLAQGQAARKGAAFLALLPIFVVELNIVFVNVDGRRMGSGIK